MKRIKRTLPIATASVVLTAGSIAIPTFVLVEPTSASPAAGRSAAPATPADANGKRAAAKSPAELLKMLGERIVAKDIDGIIALHDPEAAIVNYDGSIIRGHKEIRAFYIDWFTSDPVLTVNPLQTVTAGGKRTGNGKVRNRTAAIMGKYTLEQTGSDGTREIFTGNFCDTVQEQPNGTWLYVQDNPYPPHGDTSSAHH
ncbi:nuclear transport factor 2 family protein [Streptomyces sp. F63]|uniref:YybH family protein n=1 Tax=Streptomyces sp. F63 TaxID=2824887 RepID=UPI001B359925|nr:nuclear transport factor 2 family protein [Streptomyces sp. F63]MBQ0985371.1 nuclear transport factor 2 family protein [Streptomyces sp. F63]